MPEILAQTLDSTRIRTDARLWQFFGDHKIYFGPHTWEHIPVMDIPTDCRLEEYTLFNNGGRVLTSMGALSYQMTGAAVGSMGRFCSIAAHVEVMGERHPVEHVTTSPFTYQRGRVNFDAARRDLDLCGCVARTIPDAPLPTLGHDVWVGDGALLARGITLGHGCIVGARSVVTKDVAPYTIVAGNPARVIRKRFPDQIIQQLLSLKWWDLHPRVLFDHDIRRPDEFITTARNLEPHAYRSIGAQDVLAVN